MKSDILLTLPVSGNNSLLDTNLMAEPINDISTGNNRELSVTDVVIPTEKKSRKRKIFKRFIQIFSTVIRPILTFVPNLINALANLKRASALVC